MTEGSSELTAAVRRVFADDGKLDLPELDYLLAVAMRDGAIDPGERRVLAALFDRIAREAVPEEVWSRIAEARAGFGL
ncbi:MAG TPA: hypothetical protein VF263_11210 [Longimicrobiaceae bacterium]